MRIQSRSEARTGSILPMTAMCLVGLLGMVALSIDIGMMLCARTKCQAVADAAAITGARSLTGDVANNNNYAGATANLMNIATSSTVLNRQVQSSWVAYEIGYYTYNRSNSTFGKILPSGGGTMPTGESWSLVSATINYSDTTYFARAMNINTYALSATAVAVHRPRDLAIIIDFSGSMSFDSLLGGTYSGTRTQSLNPDPAVPKYGHYSVYNPVASAGYVIPSGELLGLSNLTTATDAGLPLVNDYYQNNQGAFPVQAFTAQPASYGTTPGGDKPLKIANNNGANYAASLSTALSPGTQPNSSWEPSAFPPNPTTCGYSMSALNGGTDKPFSGYTMGPAYWGKTFFIWPPDPRTPSDVAGSVQPGDWRKRFFSKDAAMTQPLDDNTRMWTNGSTTLKAPGSGSGFYINYAAILRWLKNTGTNPFPPQLRSGRINYYSAIPDVSNPLLDAALNTRFTVQNPVNLNERFWKHYIDFVLGFQQTGSGPTYTVVQANIGYGADFSWGSVVITSKPGTAYMNYPDNPPRPKTRFWFGPMTMLDFIDNYNQNRRWCSGIAHQASSWGCKIGMRAAMLDIQKNHPNDLVCLTYFNTPEYSAGDGGKFNRVRCPLGRNYPRMIDSLFYPPYTINNPGTEVNCYDSANMLEVPHASGSTTPVMSFMLAYNQFSSNSGLQNYNPPPALTGDAGGFGRIGAQKVVIFETDGMANNDANAAFQNAGAYQSYFKIRNGEYPTNNSGSYSSLENQLYGVAQTIANLDTANPPGYSTPKRPALIHSIAYGSLFDAALAPGAAAQRNAALALLQQVQYIGHTQINPSTPLPSYKIIIGNSTQRVVNMQAAFQKIMQDSVTVTLIE